MEDKQLTNNSIQDELSYYKRQLSQVSGDNIRSEYLIAGLKHELKQKKEAFAILTRLQQEFMVTTPLSIIFNKTVKAITSHLSMDKALILMPTATPNMYKAGSLSGFPEDQLPALEVREIELSPTVFASGQYLLVNKTAVPGELECRIMKRFSLKYFVGVPIMLDERPIGFIVCGRDFEKIPFHPPLDKGDTDTMMAIAGLITSVAQNKKMMDLKLRMLEQVEETNEIVNIFSQQVSRDVATALMSSKEEKGSRKKVPVMFLDIRNFTPFVQHKQPEETVQFLNSLFGFMTEIIDEYNGIVNQFLGDGFMTTFGAPVMVDNPYQNAVDAALCIHKVLQQKIHEGLIPPTVIGIGIHGGEAVTGNIGSTTRKQYAITGNVVIIAARIEQLTKQYGAQILISADVKKEVELLGCEEKSIGKVPLKGLSEEVELYQLI